ncbi:hypothetical protein [Paenibacillus ferrarius]|uniref:hypothetical protein n=1 Tax=Paenibacillus ferrarius TaxID=1469647 RepID=UPI003D26D38C
MKWMTWLSKIVIGTVLITMISMFTTWFVVNMYVEDIFRQYQIPALGKKIHFGEFTSRLAEELNIVKRKDGGKQAAQGGDASGSSPAPSPSPSGAQVSPSPSPATSMGSTQGTDSLAASGSGSGVSPNDDDAVAVMGRAQVEDNEQKKQLVMSEQDFTKKKDALTSEDKMKIFSLVVAKLPQDEVQKLSLLLEDGITAEEMDQVNTTLKKYLSDQEMSQLMVILNKY